MEQTAPTPGTGSTATVLLVDDEAMVRDLYRLALEHAGHRVIEAANGEEGLRRAMDDWPDVIFLDVRMPKMDGIEMLRGLKAVARAAEIPVVMLSNYDEPALVRESLSLGARGYVLKVGTDPRELAGIVTRVLSGAEVGTPSPRH
jgi:two-component system chemotaxis response regulator CheY